MPEYSLNLGLVLLVALAAISLTGGSIKDFFTNASNSMTDAVTEAAQIPQSPPPSGPVTLTFSDGRTIILKDYPPDLQKVLETLGSDGNSSQDEARERLVEIANALWERGKITKNDKALLNRLANREVSLSGFAVGDQNQDHASVTGCSQGQSSCTTNVATPDQFREIEESVSTVGSRE